jgi:hypothetical protein
VRDLVALVLQPLDLLGMVDSTIGLGEEPRQMLRGGVAAARDLGEQVEEALISWQ